MRVLLAGLLAVSVVLGVEVGEVKEVKGRVDILEKDSVRPTKVRNAGARLSVGDLLRTKRNGYAKVDFVDGSKVEVFELSRLRILDYREMKEVSVRRGVVKFTVTSMKGVEGFRVITPHAIIGVKGTVFWVYVAPGYTRVITKEGKVVIRHKKTGKETSSTPTSQTQNQQSTTTNKPPVSPPDPFANRPPANKSSIEVKVK